VQHFSMVKLLIADVTGCVARKDAAI